jgi:hypothetical protein
MGAVSQPGDIAVDIDIYDSRDLECCTEYVHEIFEYLRAKEVRVCFLREWYFLTKKNIPGQGRGASGLYAAPRGYK